MGVMKKKRRRVKSIWKLELSMAISIGTRNEMNQVGDDSRDQSGSYVYIESSEPITNA